MPIKTIYVYHDCFVVKTPEAVLVFDFWKDPYQSGTLPNPLADVKKGMPVYVFVSHFHKDHFNREIFSWARHFSDIRFIISKDVKKRIKHILSPTSTYNGDKVDPSLVITMSDCDNYKDPHIEVMSFPSTDIGNSYAISVAGRTIFHAGDLNAWIWKEESSPEEVNKALDEYNHILDQIHSAFSRFDLCFFPVDSRIGSDYFTGARLFLQRFKISCFFPMHFELGESPEDIARLHRDAAAFHLYRSPDCPLYIMSAPYSACEMR